MRGARVIRQWRRSSNEKIPVLFGKADHAFDRYREVKLQIENDSGTQSEATFRCYNDAVALRYEIVAGGSEELVKVVEERTSFEVDGEPMTYAQYLENYKTSHEHEVTTVGYANLKHDTLIDLPLTFLWKNGVYAAITEAA